MITLDEDLGTLLQRAAMLGRDRAQAAWDAAEQKRAEEDEENPETGYELWFQLDCGDLGVWEAGYCYQPGEAVEWAKVGRQRLCGTGRTPRAAVEALLELPELRGTQ